MVTYFGASRRKLAYPPSFSALAFHNGWEDRNTDARVNTADDPSTTDKNLVNVGPVIPEFCRRVFAGRASWTRNVKFHEISYVVVKILMKNFRKIS